MTQATPRRHSLARRSAIAVWALSMGFCLVAVVILLSTAWVSVPVSWGFRGSSILVALTFGTVGLVIALRRPTHAIAWLFLAIGSIFAVESLVIEYVIAGTLAVPGRLPAVTPAAWLLTWIWVPPIGLALIFLPLLFPSGHLLSPRWRPVAWLGAIATAAFAAVTSIEPGPIQQATFVDNPLGIASAGLELVRRRDRGLRRGRRLGGAVAGPTIPPL